MGFLIQLCQHSSDTSDLFLPRNSKSYISDRAYMFPYVKSKAKPNDFLSLNMGGSMHF